MFKVFSKFYFNYAVNRISFYILIGVSTAITLISTITILVLSNSEYSDEEFVNKSLLIAFPIIIWIILSMSYSSWLMFSKTRQNGLELYMMSKPLSINKTFLSKAMVSILTTILIGTIQIVAQTIIFLIIYGNVPQSFLFSISMILGLIFVSIFLFSITAFISIYFLPNASLLMHSLLMALSFSLLMLPVLVNSSSSNQANWNTNVNGVNYATVMVVDDFGNVKEEYLANYDQTGGVINTDRDEHALRKNPLTMQLLNPTSWITNSMSFVYSTANINNGFLNELNVAELTDSNYQFSMVDWTSNYSGSISSIANSDDSIVVMSPNHLNIYKENADAIYKELSKSLNYITDEQLFDDPILYETLHNKLTTDLSWSRLSLTDVEMNVLRIISGYNYETTIIHNLQSDWEKLSKKVPSIFEKLRVQHDTEIVNLIEYMITDRTAYENSVISTFITSIDERSEFFPNMGYKDENVSATYKDIDEIKNIISHNGATFRAKNTLGIFENFDMSLVFPDIQDHNEWVEYIDENIELVNIEAIYKTLSDEFKMQYPGEQILSVTFENNKTDLFLLTGLIEFESNILLSAFSGFLGILSLSGYLTYKTINKLNKRDIG